MCRNFPCLVAGGQHWATPVLLAAPTWSNELVVDSNVWRAWQWFLFILYRMYRILEDSDDDSNLSDDFDEIKN